jgi:HAMP domain-containing protein/tRNA A-37 threonylcarbamoyl transferase component Bud32
VTDTKTGSRRLGLSLGTRIFLVSSLLIALSVGSAVAITFFLIQRIARAAAVDSVRSSSAVQATFEKQRYGQLELLARLFVSDPYLTAYIAEAAGGAGPAGGAGTSAGAGGADLASIVDLLGERQSDLGFDFAIVLDPRGRVIARTDRPTSAGQDFSRRPLVAKAVEETRASGVWQEGDDLFYAVAVPLQKDFSLVGYLVTGFAITDESAKQVNQVSGADVAFVSEPPAGEPRIVATTLAPDNARSLEAALRSQEGMGGALRSGKVMPETDFTMAGEPWIGVLSPLLDAAGKPVGATVAVASLAKELAAYRRIQGALLIAGLAAVLLAPFLSYALVRRTLAPVRRLVTAAEAARQGDYDQKIASDRDDEVGRLAHSFDELLADLREKRDMEAYVTELSRNLPEPAQARGVMASPQVREVLLLGVELRGYARAAAEPGPQEVLDRLARDLKRLTSVLTSRRGQIESVSGHRLIARFEGDGRGLRALAAVAQILDLPPGAGPAEEADVPAAAMVSGRVVAGPVSWNDQLERALVGLPVQQLDSLLREATSGEVLMSREVHEELRERLEQTGYQLAQRRGIVTPMPLYALSSRMAARVTGLHEAGTETATLSAGAAQTLSGVAPGALMGQRFEILAVLGMGGMGVVYKARDRELDDLVALKMMKRELWGDRTQIERLKSEIKLARKITHPNVLRTYDFGEIDGIPYLSMEYVRGVTLRYMLDQSDNRLPFSAGLRLSKQLCAGLGAAHAVGVIHRDIKPENLILEPTGNAKLMDFGIARPVHRVEPGQTQAGFIVGTPQYLSPEQLQGQEADTRADIYSCGVVFYEIFTGVLPFTGATAVEVIVKHVREEPKPPSSHWRDIPPPLEGIILRCLKKNPNERYRSVEDLLHDLEGLSA